MANVDTFNVRLNHLEDVVRGAFEATFKPDAIEIPAKDPFFNDTEERQEATINNKTRKGSLLRGLGPDHMIS